MLVPGKTDQIRRVGAAVHRRTGRTTLKASYRNHDRRGLIDLRDVLEFRSGNANHRPELDALDQRHADARPGLPATTSAERQRATGASPGAVQQHETA